jgi:hypothetical protein
MNQCLNWQSDRSFGTNSALWLSGKTSAPRPWRKEVLRDYVQRCSDEELIARSSDFARRAAIAMEETEEVIRRHRRQKKR